MPAALDCPVAIDWAGIRAASVVVGVREAARQASAHLPGDEQTRFVERVMKRCSREGWVLKADAVRNSVRTMQQAIPLSANVRNGAEIVQNVLLDDSKETRTSLSKSARRLAKDAETAPLDQAGDVLQVGKLAALVHGWSSQQVSMRISMFGSSADLLESLPEAQVTLEMDEQPGDPLDDY